MLKIIHNKKNTVKNVLYVGFWGKLMTMYFWFRFHDKVSFKEYLSHTITK